MKNLSVIIFFCLTLLFPETSSGEPFHRLHLDHHNGLSSNYVRGIGQDGHGFVWVATIDGLNRFDGTSFRRFSKENSGLSSNELNYLLADPTNPNILWISTRHDGLCTFDYNTCRITRFKGGLYTNDIPHLSKTSEGKIWVTHYHSTPDLLDPVTHCVTGLYSTPPTNFPKRCWCTVEDPSGRYLYTGHDGNGFTRVDLVNKKFENFVPDPTDPGSIKGSSVFCIYIDGSGLVWAGTDKGVSVFNPINKRFVNISHDGSKTSLLPGQVKSICAMDNGDLWFGTTDGGVSILPASKRIQREYTFINITPTDTPYPTGDISSPTVTVVMEDSYGNIWIGNNSSGIDVLTHEPPFFTISEPFSSGAVRTGKQAVWSIATDSDGKVWLGGDNEVVGADATPGARLVVSNASAGYSSRVKALLGDRVGRLWVGTSLSGICVYAHDRKKTTRIEIPDKEITGFAEDDNGSIWIGTSDGLYRSDDGISAQPMLDYTSRLPNTFVMSLTVDNGGNLWVGTLGKGFVKFSKTGTVLMAMDDKSGLPSNTVNTIMEDSGGNVWLGTREGAVRISGHDTGDIMVLCQADGLTGSSVKSIQEDLNGNIWLGTNRGIVLFTTTDGKISIYKQTYPSNLESYNENASAIDSNGRIYFGSLNGLTSFNPNTPGSRHNERLVTLTGLVAYDNNGSDHNLEIEIPVNSDRITLPYNLNTFTIKFNTPDIALAANSEYSYNMEGVNEVWTKVNVNNEAMYRNLRPGKYRFQIRHRINGEEWSEPQTLAYITVTPPVWLSWWAMLLYVITGCAVVFIVIHFYKHKLNLEKNLVIERENIKNVQSLNEERMVFFTNITHELRTPLSLIIGPIEDLVNDPSINDANRKKLLTIRTSSMRLLNLINGILEFRKTETRNRKLAVIHDNLANFVREIGLRFKELNNNEDVSIVIDVAGMEGVEMFYDPELITTIINNMMGNAMKYTRTGSITLSLRPVSAGGVKYADLAVADTGTGISKDDLPHVFKRYYQASNSRKTAGTGIGLALTKTLVELHQATISVTSEEGKGSTFTVRLLLDNSYPDAIHREVDELAKSAGTNHVETASHDSDGKLVLLIVEDDNDMREYVAQAFADNFKVITATNGREGYNTALSEMPDIIVSDIMMPEMDGIEMCNMLKSEMATNHIPIILLTAKDTLRDKEEGYTSGADSYITKPFSATLLRARINNIIESRHKLTMRLLDIPGRHHAETEAGTDHQKTHLAEGSESAGLSKMDKEFITKFSRIVEDNMEMEEFDQTFLADRMCMSHSTLYRKVKSIAGLTPNEFIRKIKLRRATELLADSSLTVADIAAMTGFGSAAYFRRLFKKEFGVSPSEYTHQSPSDAPTDGDNDQTS